MWFWLGFQTISRVIPGTGRAGAAFGVIPLPRAGALSGRIAGGRADGAAVWESKNKGLVLLTLEGWAAAPLAAAVPALLLHRPHRQHRVTRAQVVPCMTSRLFLQELLIVDDELPEYIGDRSGQHQEQPNTRWLGQRGFLLFAVINAEALFPELFLP